ncbi:unnamed protein product [Diabrotica balteata]|uniref:Uncharacterized protein n=1 Tax=Diabrotica balteata TaxID=107213 RepID=A0A9N9SNV3_DIABA|nr:unnamed protein product [Diabrotica balteata]
MLIFVFSVIMFGVQANSLCSDYCNCSSLKVSESANANLSADIKQFLSDFPDINLSFVHPYTVVIKTSDNSLNSSGNYSFSWVKTLVLSQNNLTSVPGIVCDFSTVQNLDLSNNELANFDSDCSRTLKLLNLSSNFISTLNDTSFSNSKDLYTLDISNNFLSAVPSLNLPNLQYLNLSSNRIIALTAEVFVSLKLLQYLDVSRNCLGRIATSELTNLMTLIMAGNVDLANTRDIFFLGRKIQTLDASRTGLQQVPAILIHSIRHLTLRVNFIRTINGGDLDSYPLLNSLDVSSNVIKFIEEDALGRLDFLSFLYLADNQLVEIPRRLPEKLKLLNLGINKIGIIRKKDFQGLGTLETLFLNDNNITVINEGAFTDLLSLKSLDLSSNPIINLPPGIFTGPLSLRTLRLSFIKTPMGLEEDFPLSVPEQVVQLNLSSSPGLVHQFLADTATLMASKRLQELDVTSANLEFVRQDLQFFLPQLKVLYIRGNKLNDTLVNWVKSWICEQDVDAPRLEHNFEFVIQNTSEGSVENKRLSGTGLMRQNANGDAKKSLEASTGEISMYKSEKRSHFFHTILLITSTAVIVFFISVFSILRLFKIRRSYVEDIEATALPTISDIW